MPRPNRQSKSPVPKPYAEIGSRLKEFRLSISRDQNSFSITQQMLSRYETGLRAPTMEYLQELATLGADLNYIITGESQTDS